MISRRYSCIVQGQQPEDFSDKSSKKVEAVNENSVLCRNLKQIDVTEVTSERLIGLLVTLLEDAAGALETDGKRAKACIARASALLQSHDMGSLFQYGVRGETVATEGSSLARWQIRRIETHIDANLASRISIADLAETVGLSAGYFSRVFKRGFGETPHAYVLRRRMKYAQDLMLTTGDPLCQIALACGLSDQAHLSRLFRREIGVSPSVWRRQSGQSRKRVVAISEYEETPFNSTLLSKSKQGASRQGDANTAASSPVCV